MSGGGEAPWGADVPDVVGTGYTIPVGDAGSGKGGGIYWDGGYGGRG